MRTASRRSSVTVRVNGRHRRVMLMMLLLLLLRVLRMMLLRVLRGLVISAPSAIVGVLGGISTGCRPVYLRGWRSVARRGCRRSMVTVVVRVLRRRTGGQTVGDDSVIIAISTEPSDGGGFSCRSRDRIPSGTSSHSRVLYGAQSNRDAQADVGLSDLRPSPSAFGRSGWCA